MVTSEYKWPQSYLKSSFEKKNPQTTKTHWVDVHQAMALYMRGFRSVARRGAKRATMGIARNVKNAVFNIVLLLNEASEKEKL